jgi:CarD family transcriptional regulator
MHPVLQVGTQVVYGIHGVCNITGTEFRTVDRKKVEYLILEPNDQPGACFYVPAHNQVALSKLRPVLTREELEALIVSDAAKAECWIPSENLRKQRYRELINNADQAALISMIRMLHRHREEQLAAGRKFHLCDENFLRDAKKVLSSEFSLVLGIPHNEVAAYIESKLSE